MSLADQHPTPESRAPSPGGISGTPAPDPDLNELLLHVADGLADIKRGLVTLCRVTANARSQDADDAWWIGTKVLDGVTALSAFVEGARKPVTLEVAP